MVTKECLELKGLFEVHYVSSVQEALEKIKQTLHDVHVSAVKCSHL